MLSLLLSLIPAGVLLLVSCAIAWWQARGIVRTTRTERRPK